MVWFKNIKLFNPSVRNNDRLKKNIAENNNTIFNVFWTMKQIMWTLHGSSPLYKNNLS